MKEKLPLDDTFSTLSDSLKKAVDSIKEAFSLIKKEVDSLLDSLKKNQKNTTAQLSKTDPKYIQEIQIRFEDKIKKIKEEGTNESGGSSSTDTLSKETEATQKYEEEMAEVIDSLLNKYKNYTTQKEQINKTYDDSEKALLAARNKDNEAIVDATLKSLKDKRGKALKEINDIEAQQYVKSAEFLTNTLKNASTNSIGELRKIMGSVNDFQTIIRNPSEKVPDSVIDRQIEDRDSLTPEQLEQARASVRQYIEDLKKKPETIKEVNNQIEALKKTLADTSPIIGFFNSISSGIDKMSEKGWKNVGQGFEEIGTSAVQISSKLSKFGDDMGNIDILGSGLGHEIKGFAKTLEVAGEVTKGTGKLLQGDPSGIFDVASGLGKIWGHVAKVNKEHEETLKKLERQAEQQKHLYNIEKQRESLKYKDGKNAFGSDERGKAINAAKIYADSKNAQKESLDKLKDVDVVTGSKKSGWGFWKKRKDVWSDLLQAYPKLIDANGKFDKTLADTILKTQKLDDNGKQAIQQAIDNTNLLEESYAQLEQYLSGIFSNIGKNIMSTFVDAFKGTEDAFSKFKDGFSDMLGKMIEDFIYNIRLAPIIKAASDEAMAIMTDTSKTEEQKNNELINTTSRLVDNLLNQEKVVFDDLDRWGKTIASKTGKNPFDKNSNVKNDATKGFAASITQDQASALEGRFTGLHETGLRMEEILSGISLNSNTFFVQAPSMVDEMKKHTEILNDIKQIQVKDSFEFENTNKVLKSMNETLDKIDKNTNRL